MIDIIVVIGPTASGKSQLGIDLAQQFDGEVISADSMQIYRGLDIGTAKVLPSEMQGVEHHLIDVVEMTDNYSVADFVAAAHETIQDIAQRGKVPIVVGGTGLYVKALLGELNLDWPANDEQISQVLQTILDDKGLPELANELKQLAPEIAQQTDLHNTQRVLRALNVARQGVRQTASQDTQPKYRPLILGLDWPREVLYQRINQRVVNMVDAGVLTEAQAILNAGGEQLQAGKAIGYKEWFPYLQGETTKTAAIATLQQNTRRYAKRQLTYFRNQLADVHWIQPTQAAAYVANFLKQ
jgi:tRNA dimethylallyltransferase